MQIDQIFMQIKIYRIMGLFFFQEPNIRFINLHFTKDFPSSKRIYDVIKVD